MSTKKIINFLDKINKEQFGELAKNAYLCSVKREKPFRSKQEAVSPETQGNHFSLTFKIFYKMGILEIRKYPRKVTVGKVGEERQKVEKNYGKIIYRGTLGLRCCCLY